MVIGNAMTDPTTDVKPLIEIAPGTRCASEKPTSITRNPLGKNHPIEKPKGASITPEIIPRSS